MRFSERKGYRPVSEVIQTEGMSESLRNSLWNVLETFIWQRDNFLYAYQGPEIDEYSKSLWFHFFKKPIDSRPRDEELILKLIRDFFFTCQWYEVYDFLEFSLNYEDNPGLDEYINTVLTRELSGYRYVSGLFTDITDEEEVSMLQETLEDREFPGVRTHLQRALELLSNRENPDYRNSIKESISAVESLCKELTGNPKATLGDALKILERQGHVHSALREAFSKLYGYTSDEGGIRHAMLEEPSLDASDAKYFLLSCTSFVNYLKAKA